MHSYLHNLLKCSIQAFNSRASTKKSKREPHLQNSEDDGANEKNQVEPPAADGRRFVEGGDEERQRPDEGDSCHGDHGSFCRVGRDIGPVAAAVASVAAIATVPRTIATDSPVPATISASVATAVGQAHPILHVPHEGGGHTGEYANAQDEHGGQHGLDDAWRRQPLVEMLGFVLHVVRARRWRVSIVVALRTLKATWRTEAIVGG